MNSLSEIFGWYGTIAIVGAYAFVSFGVLDAIASSTNSSMDPVPSGSFSYRFASAPTSPHS